MSHIAISSSNLSKKYLIGEIQPSYRTLRDSMADFLFSPVRKLTKRLLGQAKVPNKQPETIWALEDVSFEVKHGEVIGIIGRNGAGKSTLLKVLSRITEPTSGFASIRGRAASLLEVGTGFHPELTGRENIHLNGAILGMKKSEIRRKFDEIVAFAEVERFVDTPVKHYSSGMYLRLAFSVAAHLEPEILIVDEVLAVGDVGFQKKCLGKMGTVAQSGRTVVFVSHNMGAISQLCERVLWLERGKIRLDGEACKVISSYLTPEIETSSTWKNSSDIPGDVEVQIRMVCLISEDGQPTNVVKFDAPFGVEISYVIGRPVRDLSVVCRLTDSQGNILWTSWDSDTTPWSGRVREPGDYVSVCTIPGGMLRPGRYLLSVGAHISNVKLFSYHENVLAFEVSEVGFTLNRNRIGLFTPLFAWKILPQRSSVLESSKSEPKTLQVNS
jgi:lipopolysaccharide transport system ATP-binding protein